jgi:hypothetical protein
MDWDSGPAAVRMSIDRMAAALAFAYEAFSLQCLYNLSCSLRWEPLAHATTEIFVLLTSS